MAVYQHWDLLQWFLIQSLPTEAVNVIVDKTIDLVGVEVAKNLDVSMALPV